MKVVYAQEPFPETLLAFAGSIFLAGPTPRSPNVASWRPEALRIFSGKSFNGVVFVPEPRHGSFGKAYDYTKQVEWEEYGLVHADCILFWIPRNVRTLPGFTTNVEFGFWVRSGKIVLGAPENAPHMNYLRAYARKYGVPQAATLEEAVDHAMQVCQKKSG